MEALVLESSHPGDNVIQLDLAAPPIELTSDTNLQERIGLYSKIDHFLASAVGRTHEEVANLKQSVISAIGMLESLGEERESIVRFMHNRNFMLWIDMNTNTVVDLSYETD